MTDRLFKFGSLEDEIMKSMETSLVKVQRSLIGHEKLSKAVDHLNAAAEIFDDSGFSKEAEFVTRLIEKLADVTVQQGPQPKFDLTGNDDLYEMIDSSVPEYKKSPINSLIEEELSKQEIKNLLDKGDVRPAEPFAKSPSIMPPPLNLRNDVEPFRKSPSAMPPAFEDPLSDVEFENMFGNIKSDKMESRLASDKKKV
jgi:hypothetical protein